jgi:ABC-type branched-subunit amino acid transport system substrate-binding protein
MPKKKGLEIMRIAVLAVFVGIFLNSGCAKRIPDKKEELVSPQAVQANRILDEAERQIEAGEYQKAILIYDDYLSQPGPLLFVDRVLMRQGNVHIMLGEYEAARNSYQALIFDYPDSPWAGTAKFNIADTYYREMRYKDAIFYAESLLSAKTSPKQRVRLALLIGDSFLKEGKYSDAVLSYLYAYRAAQGEGKQRPLERIKRAVPGLAAPDIARLVRKYNKYEKDEPYGHILFQQARLLEEEGLESNAQEVLFELVTDLPAHELAGPARELAERLEKDLAIDKWTIGCILPLTGPYEKFGMRVLAGIELAVAEFNASSDGAPVRLIIKDSKGDPEVAVDVLEYLVNEAKVIGIIGPMITAESLAETAQNLGIPIIALTQKQDITRTGDYVFRNFLTPLQQIRTIVPYAIDKLGYRKFAILYPDDVYGVRFMDLFWDELIKHGGQVVGVESYQAKQTDFAHPIKKITGMYYERFEPEATDSDETTEEEADLFEIKIEAEEDTRDEATENEEPEAIVDFDAVFVPDTSGSINLIAPQLAYNDVSDVLLIGTNLWHSRRLLEQSAGYVQGAVFPTGFYYADSRRVVREFVNSFEETFGKKPCFLNAQGHDAATLLLCLIEDPAIRTRNALKIALSQVEMLPMITGFISFDETGDAIKELTLLKVKGKRFIQVK